MAGSLMATAFDLDFEAEETAEAAYRALTEVPTLLENLNCLRLQQLERLQVEQRHHPHWLSVVPPSQNLQSTIKLCREKLLQVQHESTAEYASDDTVANAHRTECNSLGCMKGRKRPRITWPVLYSVERVDSWKALLRAVRTLKSEQEMAWRGGQLLQSSNTCMAVVNFAYELQLVCFYSSITIQPSPSGLCEEHCRVERQLRQEQQQQQKQQRQEQRNRNTYRKQRHRRGQQSGCFVQQQQKLANGMESLTEQMRRSTTRLYVHEQTQVHKVRELWDVVEDLLGQVECFEPDCAANPAAAAAAETALHAEVAAARRAAAMQPQRAALMDLPWLLLHINNLHMEHLQQELQETHQNPTQHHNPKVELNPVSSCSEPTPIMSKLQAETDPYDDSLLRQVLECRDALLSLQKKSFVAASLGSPYAPAVQRLCDITRTLPQPLLSVEATKKEFANFNAEILKLESKYQALYDAQHEVVRDSASENERRLMLTLSTRSCLPLFAFLGDVKRCCMYSEISQRQEEHLLQLLIGKLSSAPQKPDIRRNLQQSQKAQLRQHGNAIRLLRRKASRLENILNPTPMCHPRTALEAAVATSLAAYRRVWKYSKESAEKRW